jgi:phage terminase Nu1 subunit (DNA packaging protein)
MAALTGPQLCEKLGIDAKQLAAWVRLGIPASGRGKLRTFDPLLVRDWLLEKKLAEQPPPPDLPPTDQPIAHTIAQVAEYFQVSERAVHTWIKQGMPGKAGRPGTQEGAFPLFEIEAWREGRKTPRLSTSEETKSQAQARLSTIKADMLELDLREKRGELIDANEIARRWARVTTEARAILAQLPALVAKQLPAELDAKVRKKARQVASRLVEQCAEALESFLSAEADAAESEDPDGSGEEA